MLENWSGLDGFTVAQVVVAGDKVVMERNLFSRFGMLQPYPQGSEFNVRIFRDRYMEGSLTVLLQRTGQLCIMVGVSMT